MCFKMKVTASEIQVINFEMPKKLRVRLKVGKNTGLVANKSENKCKWRIRNAF